MWGHKFGYKNGIKLVNLQFTASHSKVLKLDIKAKQKETMRHEAFRDGFHSTYHFRYVILKRLHTL